MVFLYEAGDRNKQTGREKTDKIKTIAHTGLLGRQHNKKVKSCMKFFTDTHHRATERHLPYVITQCYLPPDTSKRTRFNPSQTGRYLIHMPRKYGKLG